MFQTCSLPAYGMVWIWIFDNCIGQRTTAVAGLGCPQGQIVEIGQNLCAGVIWVVVTDCVDPPPECLLVINQVRSRQPILGFKSPVEEGLVTPAF